MYGMSVKPKKHKRGAVRTRVTVSMPLTLESELITLAKSHGVSINKFCLALIQLGLTMCKLEVSNGRTNH
jgi:hypothetical protein